MQPCGLWSSPVSQIRFGICSLTAGLNIETKEECNKKKAGECTDTHLLMKVKHHSAPAWLANLITHLTGCWRTPDGQWISMKFRRAHVCECFHRGCRWLLTFWGSVDIYTPSSQRFYDFTRPERPLVTLQMRLFIQKFFYRRNIGRIIIRANLCFTVISPAC